MSKKQKKMLIRILASAALLIGFNFLPFEGVRFVFSRQRGSVWVVCIKQTNQSKLLRISLRWKRLSIWGRMSS